MDPYATHQRLLIAAAMQTDGPIIEMGCGDYSTPLLAEIAAHQGRTFEVYTADRKWGSKYELMCRVNYINDWSKYTYPKCGLTFLDNEQYVRHRKLHVPRLLEVSDVVICHDMGQNEWGAKYATVLPLKPPTIALSQHKKILSTRRDPVTVMCVYKTGGDFTAEYVSRLFEGVLDRSTRPVRFVCLTDSDEDLPCEKIPLTEDLPGWWSKLELFKEYRGRVVYFDLDMMIVGNIDPLLDYAGPMAMLNFPQYAGKTPPHPNEWNSSIMAWNSPLQFIYPPSEERLRIRTAASGGDQEYIAAKLRKAKWHIDPIQSIIPTASYKLHCRDGVPPDTRIVYFHGPPRPHEVGWKLSMSKAQPEIKRSASLRQKISEACIADAPVYGEKDELLVDAAAACEVDGWVAELGVYKGVTLRRLVELFADETVHGFDSFEGLQEHWFGTPNDPLHAVGGYKLPNYKEIQFPESVELHVGLVQDTLPGFVAAQTKPAKFLHIDTDTYLPAEATLRICNDLIVPGTIIQFDEFIGYPTWLDHEVRAFIEWLARYKRDAVPIGVVRSRYPINQFAVKVVV
jgi:hypothetical protein